MKNPITPTILKRSAILGGFLFCINTIRTINNQLEQAVSEVNTFTAMFGSLATFVGDDVVEAWHTEFTSQPSEEVFDEYVEPPEVKDDDADAESGK